MQGGGDVGATCCSVYVAKQGGKFFLITLTAKTSLYFANLGDTRATLSHSGVAVRLTIDHKATEPTEVDRVKYQTPITILETKEVSF